MVRSVEDLEVFRRAYRLSLELHRLSLELPRIEQFALADQLRRASKSICANLTEGFAKQSHSAAEYRRYIVTAMGSSDETQWAAVTRRSCGASISVISTRSEGRDGSPTLPRSAGCCVVSMRVGAGPTPVLTPDS